jgi:hypothetical protein
MIPMTRFCSTLVAAAVVSVAVLVAVAPTPAQAPKRGGILRVAEQSDPVGFDTLGKKKALLGDALRDLLDPRLRTA